MADDICPLCEGKGAGLPGYFGTMADMFTLLFAFFVLMFSMATMDPAQMPGEGGVEGEGSAEEQKEKIEKEIEEIKKEEQALKELGIAEIDGQPIEEYMDSVVQEIKEERGSKHILPFNSITVPLISFMNTVASDESNFISSIISAKSP